MGVNRTIAHCMRKGWPVVVAMSLLTGCDTAKMQSTMESMTSILTPEGSSRAPYTPDTTQSSSLRAELYSAIERTESARKSDALVEGFIGIALPMLISGGQFGQALQQNFAQAVTELRSASAQDAENMRIVTQRLEAVRRNRVEQAAEINREARRNAARRRELGDEMALLRTLMQEDATAAAGVLGTVEERSEQFELAAAEARQKAKTPEQRRQVREVDRTLQTNQAVYQSSKQEIAKVEAEAKGDAFELAMLLHIPPAGPEKSLKA